MGVLSMLVLAALAGVVRSPGVGATQNIDMFSCGTPHSTSGDEPRTLCYDHRCTESITEHIQYEINAAFSYMYMAAHFDDDRIARPGLAKFLYESADEERSHAIMMLDYLRMRGVYFDTDFNFDPSHLEEFNLSPSYLRALRKALVMEVDVTRRINNIVSNCTNDYHGADFFTEPFLAEQHEGLTKLQVGIRRYQHLTGGHTTDVASLALAEFIFDKKVLEEGL